MRCAVIVISNCFISVTRAGGVGATGKPLLVNNLLKILQIIKSLLRCKTQWNTPASNCAMRL